MSHPVWVRGLKPYHFRIRCVYVPSHPVWVRGLKLVPPVVKMGVTIVAPRVGAWIETPAHASSAAWRPSHPVWVRGLKLAIRQGREMPPPVAPRVGAWIETSLAAVDALSRNASHPVWVRGLKHNLSFRAHLC